MKNFRLLAMALFVLVALVPVVMPENGSLINKEDSFYKISLSAESGLLTVINHSIQFGQAGTRFDYKEEGNQDILFPYLRFSAALRLYDIHEIVFLYQPLEIITKAKAARNITIYTTVFPSGSVLDLKYGFSFYRASYVWYFMKDGKNELGAGLSMQVRNASIVFEAGDGTEIAIQENVGPVPILKLSGKYVLDNGLWGAFDADGFYASSAIFNGADFPFVGAIWDVSLRIGIELKNNISPYLNVRCLGGGAEGTSTNEDAQGDGYTRNWLNTISVTLGAGFN
jgi:hypothetical protein